MVEEKETYFGKMLIKITEDTKRIEEIRKLTPRIDFRFLALYLCAIADALNDLDVRLQKVERVLES